MLHFLLLLILYFFAWLMKISLCNREKSSGNWKKNILWKAQSTKADGRNSMSAALRHWGHETWLICVKFSRGLHLWWGRKSLRTHGILSIVRNWKWVLQSCSWCPSFQPGKAFWAHSDVAVPGASKLEDGALSNPEFPWYQWNTGNFHNGFLGFLGWNPWYGETFTLFLYYFGTYSALFFSIFRLDNPKKNDGSTATETLPLSLCPQSSSDLACFSCMTCTFSPLPSSPTR